MNKKNTHYERCSVPWCWLLSIIGELSERSRMDQRHRVPNLEEMDEQHARHFLTELFSNLSAQHEYAIRHEDYVMQMPQSGESIRGRKRMREFQEAYPSPPSIQLRRVIVRDGLWVVEGVNDYGEGQVFSVVLIIELRDGKM
jgi:SnoaL-like protein